MGGTEELGSWQSGPSLRPSRSCCRRGVEPPLEGVPSIEAADELPHEPVLPEKSPGCIRKAGRNAAHDSSYGDIRSELLQDVGKKGNIVLRPGAEEISGPFFVLRRHGRPLQELKLVKLEETHWQGI